MIAAARRRIGPALGKLAGRSARWSRSVDRAANRALERAHPAFLGGFVRSRREARRALAWAGPRVRPGATRFFRGLAVCDRWVRRGLRAAVRGSARLSAILTPQRALGVVIAGCGLALIASQFVDYRAVEIGQPGYAGLPSAAPAPTVDVKTAGEAHAYLLVPLGGLAVLLGLLGLGHARRKLGLAAAGLGLVALATILLVDLPNGLDAGTQTSRFAGATAVLRDGFYAELAAAAGLLIAGLLYYARPCRIRISLSGRAASGRRRRPRRRASSRARVARSA